MARSKSEVLQQELLALVESVPAGQRIPSERELCERFGVARETLRRVLDDLAAAGQVVRRRGAGTFVQRPKIMQQFVIQSFTQDMQARKMSSSSKLLWHRRERAGARLGALLQVSPGDEVLTMKRLRLADGESMALEVVSLPAALVPGLDVEMLADHSLYQTLGQQFGIDISGGSQTLEATVVDEDEAAALGVPVLSPALLVERVTWMEDGRRVEAVKSIYRGDRYRFHMELARSTAMSATSDG